MAFATGNQKGLCSEINITPMIDILLVLIICFMLMQHQSHGEDALVPQPSTDSRHLPPPARTIVVQLVSSPAGRPELKINQDPVSWQELRTRLFDIYKQRAEKVMFVKANEDLEFSDVADVIGIAHEAGVSSVGLITGKMEEAP